jgi:hypothetical protein
LFILAIYSVFLVPKTLAQTWSYDGADTTKIPVHSVYPSERFAYDTTVFDDRYLTYEIGHGNMTNHGSGDTYSVWGNRYYQNKTTGVVNFLGVELLSSWNESIGYQGNMLILPIESDGKLSQTILDKAKNDFIDKWSTQYPFQYNQAYISSNSIRFWNSTLDGSYLHYNYTEDGILTDSTWYYPNYPTANATIVSKPAQLPPEFSFTTGEGILNNSDFKLKLNITNADNNNDGLIDNDYLFRVFNGSEWINWTILPSLVDYELNFTSGSYQIILEVKNMYGVTRKEIRPAVSEGVIPGYSTLIIAMVFFLGIVFKLSRYKCR